MGGVPQTHANCHIWPFSCHHPVHHCCHWGKQDHWLSYSEVLFKALSPIGQHFIYTQLYTLLCRLTLTIALALYHRGAVQQWNLIHCWSPTCTLTHYLLSVFIATIVWLIQCMLKYGIVHDWRSRWLYSRCSVRFNCRSCGICSLVGLCNYSYNLYYLFILSTW